MINLIIVIIAQYLFLLSILIALIYFLTLERSIKKELFILSSISFALSLLIAKISSKFIYDPRPFVVEHIKPLFFHAPNNGFPSDHTLLTMAIASVVFAFNKKIGIVLFVIAVLIGTARVLSSVHHVIDILGSAFIAIGVTYIVVIGKRHFFKKSSQ